MYDGMVLAHRDVEVKEEELENGLSLSPVSIGILGGAAKVEVHNRSTTVSQSLR